MKTRLLAEAEVEAQEAAQWYEARQTGLGEAFLDALSDGLEALEQHPTRYPRLQVFLPIEKCGESYSNDSLTK